MGLGRSIATAYRFMRNDLGLLERNTITMEEFEVIEERLRQIAKKEVKKIWRRLLMPLGIKSRWSQFLSNGSFPNRYCDSEIHSIIFYNKGFTCSLYVPVNIRKLISQLYEKRYGVLNGNYTYAIS